MAKKHNKKPTPVDYRLNTHEKRILFSADPLPLDFGSDEVSASHVQLYQPISSEPASDEHAASVEESGVRHRLAIIDAQTPNIEQLTALLAQQGITESDIVFLDTQSLDASLNTITEALAERGNVASMHWFSHGDDGMLSVGR